MKKFKFINKFLKKNKRANYCKMNVTDQNKNRVIEKIEP